MFGTLVLGILAGAAAPYAEPYVTRGLESAAMAETPLAAVELRAFSLALCLVAAAVLAWLMTSGGAVSLTVGAALGVFAPRLIQRVRRAD